MNWAFWLELLVRSAALLMVGEALRRVSRRQSAAFRHKLLLWVLALLALLPVLSVIFPEIPIRLWAAPETHRGYVTAHEIASTVVLTSSRHVMNWPFVIWFAGAIVALTPLLAGAVSAWLAGRRAAPVTPAVAAAIEQIRSPHLRGTEVLVSKALPIPLTCGLSRGRILLPGSVEHWSFPRLQAVLLHELAHVRRRDVAAQVATHLVAAVWWFQPMVWVLRRSLRAESELACDAEALRSGLRPSAYAAEFTNAGGKFSVDGTAGGQYILRVEKPGFTSIFREFDMGAESTMDRQFTMTNDGTPQVADQVLSGNADSQKLIHVRGQVAQSNLKVKVNPVYPTAAKAAGIQGAVQIETTLSKDGVPVELRVLSSPSDDLSESSLEAVRQWRYRPTLLNGEPVEIVTDVLVNYTLAR